jgi:hypothetical protein
MHYCVGIGGITIAIRIDNDADARPLTPIDGPVARFVVDDRPADVEVRVSTLADYAPAPGRLVFDSGSLWSLYRDGDTYDVEFRSNLSGDAPYKVARIPADLSAAPAQVTLRTRVTEFRNSYPLQFPLDELLVNAILTQHGGIELHSCGVVDRNGDGYLFAGNSGAGKTTTARLWEGEASEILSDDRIILRRENGGWWMYGTPWHGEAEICSPSRAPLRRIFLLDKSTRNAVQPLTPAAAVARLFSCTFPPFHDASAMGAMVGTLAAIVREVPVASLSFANERGVAAFVRESFEVAA